MKTLIQTALALCGTLVLGASLNLHAAEQTITEPTLTSPTVTKSTDYKFTGIPAFDTTLGTLDSVSFTLTLYSTPYVLVYNSNMEPELYTSATTTTSAAAELLYLTAQPGMKMLTDHSGQVKAGPFSGTVPPNTMVGPFSGAQTSVSNTATVFNPGTFYDKMGNKDSYSLLSHLNEGSPFYTGSSPGGDAGLFFGGGDSIFETLSVEYFYTSAAVPEPSALSLIAMSLGVFFLGRRLVTKRAH